jgi:Spy/CpxP family protein refolding chaperone
MKTRMIGAAAALGAVLLFVPIFAQSTQTPPAPTSPAMGQRGMMGADHQQMMAEMKAADSRVQELVTKMNAAKGDQKVDAMAALLNEMVKNDSHMHHRMMEMHGRMMMPAPQK